MERELRIFFCNKCGSQADSQWVETGSSAENNLLVVTEQM